MKRIIPCCMSEAATGICHGGHTRDQNAPDRTSRIVLAQVDAMLDEARRRVVLDPEDVIAGLDRIRRVLVGTP